MSVVIQVTNLSKIYRLGEIGTGTISRDLERWNNQDKRQKSQDKSGGRKLQDKR